MAEDDVHDALLAIFSRLGTIEGKLNLVARAEREQILSVVQAALRNDPLLGQIYLLLDGVRKQKDVIDALKSHGINVSQSTVSRRMDMLVTEYGLADQSGRGATLVLTRNRGAEDVLNLTRRVRKWLEEWGEVVPETKQTRQRNRK